MDQGWNILNKEIGVGINRKVKRSYYEIFYLKDITDNKRFWATEQDKIYRMHYFRLKL